MGRGFFWATPSDRRKFPRREKLHEVFSFSKLFSDGDEYLHEGKRTGAELGFVHKSVERAGQLLAEATAKLRWVLNSCNAQNQGYRHALEGLVAKADIFRRGMLPFGNSIISNLEDLSRDYLYRSSDEFIDNLRITLEKMRDYRNHAELANLFYMEMARDLEELQKEFAGIVESLRQTEASLVADLNKKRKSRTWSEQLAILAPIVGVGAAFIVGTVGTLPAIATGITGFLGGLLGSNQANNYRIEEISLQANADIARKSSLHLESGDILERILDFSKSMGSIGEFFKTIEEDLILSIGISKDMHKRSRQSSKALQERIRQHQNRHMKTMKQITMSCRLYAIKASDAEVDLQFMNNLNLDSNYIDDWLEDRQFYSKPKQKGHTPQSRLLD